MARRRHLVLAALLFVVVAGVFAPALTHGFITYDDPTYVTDNAHETGGITWAGIRWALRSTEASNWHPLTWISHMADCQVFGLKPWGHHATNVLLHALNAALLFLALRRMTGATWRSLFVAALFGLHPLHVEAVAWVAERKEVLSAFFLMLVLLSYARRAELARAQDRSARLHYGLCLVCFALGLMSKPMLVTLPCVLLLLDFWPLNRWGPASHRERIGIILEKIPFFVLSAAASAVTLAAQAKGGTVGTLDHFPLPERIANALIAYCWYLGKTFVPAKLAIFYPYGLVQPSVAGAVLAGSLLAAVTVACVILAKRRGYLLVGWLWFLGTLVPVIGLVQVGGQSKADRYSYVPLIGLFIMAAWAPAALWPESPTPVTFGLRSRRFLAAAASVILAACAAATTHQLGYWKNGLTLFHHALDVTQDNWVAHANLYTTLGRTSPVEAEKEYNATLKILAGFAFTYVTKGLEQEKTPGGLPEAIKDYRTAIEILPILAVPHNFLGAALARTPGSSSEAVAELQTAIRLNPDYAAAHFNLGMVFARTPDDRFKAIMEFEAALRLRPDLKPAQEMIDRLESAPR